MDKKIKKDHWGIRLEQTLKEKGVSRRAAARHLNIAASVIDSWARGSTPGDLGAVKKLADHLNVSFCWLVTGEREKSETPPSLAELFKETPYFDGIARIRIDRLLPRNGNKEDKEES